MKKVTKLILMPVLPNLQFGSCEYQHFQCEKKQFFLVFPKKMLIFAAEKDLVAIRS